LGRRAIDRRIGTPGVGRPLMGDFWRTTSWLWDRREDSSMKSRVE
jgi:hypothetical protein